VYKTSAIYMCTSRVALLAHIRRSTDTRPLLAPSLDVVNGVHPSRFGCVCVLSSLAFVAAGEAGVAHVCGTGEGRDLF